MTSGSSLTILLDLGNTSGKYGLAQKGRILMTGSLYLNKVPNLITKCYQSGKFYEIIVLISSVVPYLTNKLLNKFKSIPTISFKIAGKDLSIPIKSRYAARQLGIDRKINAFGCLQFHGKPPFLILDYGSALTADYVSRAGVFEGGLIIPGPETAFNALTRKGALLPKGLPFPLKSRGLKARTTKDALQSGILEAYGALTDGLVSRFKSRYGKKIKVVATGGLAGRIRPCTRSIDRLDPFLSLRSLLALIPGD